MTSSLTVHNGDGMKSANQWLAHGERVMFKGDYVSNAMDKKGTRTMSKNTSKADKGEKVADKPTAAVPSGAIMSIPLSLIVVDEEFNARTQGMDEDSIKVFARSIDEEGMLQPPVVEAMDGGRFYLKAGFRRIAAAKLLEWDAVDCVVKEAEGATEKEQNLNRYFTNLAENVARRNLTPFDTAHRCKLLKRDYGLKGADIAKRIGMNTGYVNNLLQIVGEGEKGDNKGATLHPDIMKHWEMECGWTEDEKEKRTKICTTDTLKRWLPLPHPEQLRLYNRAAYHADNPKADMEAWDKEYAERTGGKGAGGDKPEPANDTKEVVRATKSQLEKALEATKEALKESKSKEQTTRLNGVVEGLKFALGVKEGYTNSVKGVIAYKDGKMTEGPATAASN